MDHHKFSIKLVFSNILISSEKDRMPLDELLQNTFRNSLRANDPRLKPVLLPWYKKSSGQGIYQNMDHKARERRRNMNLKVSFSDQITVIESENGKK